MKKILLLVICAVSVTQGSHDLLLQSMSNSHECMYLQLHPSAITDKKHIQSILKPLCMITYVENCKFLNLFGPIYICTISKLMI